MPRSFSFIHLADTHLGLNWPVIPDIKRVQIPAYGKAFSYVVEKAIEYGVDFILHSGDFVEHPRPTIPALRRAIVELRRLKEEGIPFIVTRGTHDSSKEYFEKLGGDFLTVLEDDGKVIYVEYSRKRKYYDLKIGEDIVRIYGLGEYGIEQRKILNEFLRSFSSGNTDFRILLIHGGLIDRPYPVGGVLSTADLASLYRSGLINYIALGHDHQHFEYREFGIYNPGSTEFCSFKEASKIFYSFKDNELKEEKREIREKGFYLVEVDNGEVHAKFEKIPTRKIFDVIVRFNGASPNEILEGMILALERNAKDKNVILRPVITGSLASGYRAYDLRLKDIQESVDALYVGWPVCSLEGITSPSTITLAKSYEPILQEYFKRRGYNEESSKKLTQLTVQIVKGLNPSSEDKKEKEVRKKKVLKLIEDFELKEVKR
ncbi:MAG: hypothetical protein DRN49_00140 [Thaumarchaeota archaeon]|nr:MAG: hypothetical protein DRN49_00140 [Nitrososphaerota archaeon]